MTEVKKIKICLCSSRKFFERLLDIKKDLEKLRYEVLLPDMKGYDDFFAEKGELEFAKIHYGLIKNHFKKINESNAILVCNFDKENIKGYIGASVLMEMAKAFDKGIPIFLLNPVPQISYRAEILGMQPIVIKNLEEIKDHIKK
jgi:hypothetical protein